MSLPWVTGQVGLLPGPGRRCDKEKQGCPHLWQVWARLVPSLFSQLHRWDLASQGCLRDALSAVLRARHSILRAMGTLPVRTTFGDD